MSLTCNALHVGCGPQLRSCCCSSVPRHSQRSCKAAYHPAGRQQHHSCHRQQLHPKICCPQPPLLQAPLPAAAAGWWAQHHATCCSSCCCCRQRQCCCGCCCCWPTRCWPCSHAAAAAVAPVGCQLMLLLAPLLLKVEVLAECSTNSAAGCGSAAQRPAGRWQPQQQQRCRWKAASRGPTRKKDFKGMHIRHVHYVCWYATSTCKQSNRRYSNYMAQNNHAAQMQHAFLQHVDY